MAKTPVSILQEYCARQMTAPHYDLIVNGVGTHDPNFKYRLTVNDIVTYGDGKSKKEAKHEAARKAVSILLPSSREVSNVQAGIPNSTQPGAGETFSSPYQDAIKQNSIGELATICCNKLMPEPEYVYIGEVGPPHARTFTYECNVAKLKEQASSRTKQQAKHLSAIKMIDRLKSVFGSLIVEVNEEVKKKEEEISDKAFDIFCKTRGKKINENFNVYIKDYHLFNSETLFDNTSSVSELKEYNSDMSKNSINSCELLNNLFQTNNKNLIYNLTFCDSKMFCFCELEPDPYFVTCGTGANETDAKLNAAHKMLVILKSFIP